MSIIMGIDPGPISSGVIVVDAHKTSGDIEMKILWTNWKPLDRLDSLKPKVEFNMEDNSLVLHQIRRGNLSNGHPIMEYYMDKENLKNISYCPLDHVDIVVIEGMDYRGTGVGDHVFQALIWSGVFAEAISSTWKRDKEWFDEVLVNQNKRIFMLKPNSIRSAICGTPMAKREHVKKSLIGRFGIGTKDNPGVLYNLAKPRMNNHLFSALAVVVAYMDGAKTHDIYNFYEEKNHGI